MRVSRHYSFTGSPGSETLSFCSWQSGRWRHCLEPLMTGPGGPVSISVPISWTPPVQSPEQGHSSEVNL